mmetsp:Transcript_37532/g.82192  ORF Transcript_37532/g.82192 Transcript_37532/m.82192 type:complete len:381 (+) Transcript_37532:192-1334(+)
MTIPAYRSSKDDEDVCFNVTSRSKKSSGGDDSMSCAMTNSTEASSVPLDDTSYSEDDDTSLTYSVSSSTASGHNHNSTDTKNNNITPPPSTRSGFLTGRIVETTPDDCSVLSLDYSCSSITVPDGEHTICFSSPVPAIKTISLPPPSVQTPQVASVQSSSSTTLQSDVNAIDFIGQRTRRSFRSSCRKQKVTNTHQEVSTKSHDHLPTIGLGSSSVQVTRVLREGWLEKKGTGSDLLGRDCWKKRYAFLVLAKNTDLKQEVEVPLLLIYRNTSVTMPSNIIPLDSAVVITGAEQLQQQPENEVTFDIVQAKQSKFFPYGDDKEKRRCFAAPRDEGKNWVQMINFALIQFEKRRAFHRRNGTKQHTLVSNTIQQWPSLVSP